MHQYSGVRRLMLTVLAVSALWLLGACGSDEPAATAMTDGGALWYPSTATAELPVLGSAEEMDLFEFLNVGVLQTSCAFPGCHLGDEPAAGLDLSTDPQAALLGTSRAVGRPLVVPFDPEASYLMEKLTASSPEEGARMPLDSQLDEYQLDLVRRWITAGARGSMESGADSVP